MTTFQERLNEALEKRDIKASELARLSGVNEGAISQYRKGKYKASQQTLDRLAAALNVSIPWLMGADVPMSKFEPKDTQSSTNCSEENLPVLDDPEIRILARKAFVNSPEKIKLIRRLINSALADDGDD